MDAFQERSSAHVENLVDDVGQLGLEAAAWVGHHKLVVVVLPGTKHLLVQVPGLLRRLGPGGVAF